MLSAVLVYYIGDAFKSFGESIDTLNDDAYLSTINSISSLFNSMRFVWAGLLDKYDFKKVFFIVLALEIALTFSMKLTS